MRYTVTVDQTAGPGAEFRVECLKWSSPQEDPVEIPIQWHENVGTMELDDGDHSLNCTPASAEVKFTVDLAPPSPIFDPVGAQWPFDVVKAVQLFFTVGG